MSTNWKSILFENSNNFHVHLVETSKFLNETTFQAHKVGSLNKKLKQTSCARSAKL